MKALPSFLFSCSVLLSCICQAQWQSDVRLTNDPANSSTSYNNAWCVAVSGPVVHVVWNDNRDGNYEIYYKRSTDAGVTWGIDTRLTNNAASSYYPSASVYDSVVHVVWHDLRDGNAEMYYKRSTDGGASWGADIRLTNDSAESVWSSIAVSGSVVHVVWNDYRDGNWEIYYKRSTDVGISWGVDMRLTNAAFSSSNPSVTVSGQVVHIAWFDSRDGNTEAYYKRSTDAGVTWGTDTRLTNNSANQNNTSLAVSGSAVHVVWTDGRDGNPEIYYKRSTDAGVSWEADTRITVASGISQSPSVSATGQAVHVAWYDNRDGNYEIYYKRSTDAGTNWETDTRLTNDPATSTYTSLTVSGSVVHVVWYDNRDGNNEIYYKRNPAGNPTGVKNSGVGIPTEFELSQNYPNPFNPSTTISYQLPTQSYVTLKIYDLLGREVSTLVREIKPPGGYEATWNATEVSSGVYFYRLQTGDFIQARKLVLMK